MNVKLAILIKQYFLPRDTNIKMQIKEQTLFQSQILKVRIHPETH